MMTRALITGSDGMLGHALATHLRSLPGFDVRTTSRAIRPSDSHLRFDLLSESMKPLLDWATPDVVIHCAALTNIDKAEAEPSLAFASNVTPVEKMIHEIESNSPKTQFIFISSDAVKPDGIPYPDETLIPAPLNVYGKTKQRAEDFILKSSANAVSLRTTLVGSKRHLGQISFTDQIFGSILNAQPMTLFNDVVFCPITARQFARSLVSLVGKKTPKLIHLCGNEGESKFQFAKRMQNRISSGHTRVDTLVPIQLSSKKLPAKRVLDQTLSCQLALTLGIDLPTLDQVVDDLIEEYRP